MLKWVVGGLIGATALGTGSGYVRIKARRRVLQRLYVRRAVLPFLQHPQPAGSLLPRKLRLAWIFLPSLLLSWMAFVPFFKHIWIQMLLRAVQRAGPLWIKLAQYLSHRADIIGEDVAEQCAVLREHSAPHSQQETHKVLAEEFGKPLDEVFERFDKQPVASGSIRNVYRAVLNGREVAVKVKHPGLQERMMSDLAILFEAISLLSKLSDFFNIPVNQAELEKLLRSQLYFNTEK